MADVYTGAREINPGTEMNGNGESRPQVPTWSVANAKEAKPQIIERSDEPEVSKPEAKVDADLSNGSHTASADADAQSDIDELLTGGDAEPEPPRYDGDFDIERHDYWWNLLDMENPRHARASKGMRYGTEHISVAPRGDAPSKGTVLSRYERHSLRAATPALSLDTARLLKNIVPCDSPFQRSTATLREFGASAMCLQLHLILFARTHEPILTISQQQRTGFPLLKVGSARKRDDMDDEDSRSPPAELAAKRPRLSSYSGGFSGDGRLSNATPSRPTFDAPPSVNGRHYSPVNVPGSVPERERNGANGDSARSARHEMDARQYYDSHDSRNDDRYQNHDRYEVSARDMNNLLNLVDKLQREVRTLRSRLDGMETRVDNISGAVDIYRP
ncbi:hypothetical protein D6D13_04268 [Aureobasidium pullulans]|uniref:Uncharacterized protein n=1 Tax=Aureobasidium pullulans TaxID=5580 RepID=A0A4S9CXG2_AURPU|nr:hypothetical protein D6D13_04268 [Aureobasidium pullulans]